MKSVLHRSEMHAYSALMEVILNSIQACNCRLTREEASYSPEIKIVFDRNSKRVSVVDNGIGITDDLIENVFLCIGRTYHTYTGIKSNLIGHRGIGFIEVFNISDVIEVETHSIDEAFGCKITCNIDNQSVVKEQVNLGDYRGTVVSFDYDSFVSNLGNEYKVERLLRNIVGLSEKIRFVVQSVNARTLGADCIECDIETLKDSIFAMQQDGDITGFIDQIKRHNKKISNRDLMKLDEKHFKFFLFFLFNFHSDYLVISEQEVEDGYIDIFLRKKIAVNVRYEWIIELKYLKKSRYNELDKVREEGLKQVAEYARSRVIAESLDVSCLKVVLIIFLGKDDVIFDLLQL